jgi:hypothetical protein
VALAAALRSDAIYFWSANKSPQVASGKHFLAGHRTQLNAAIIRRLKTWWAPGGVPPSALQVNVSQSISRVLEGLRIDDPHA